MITKTETATYKLTDTETAHLRAFCTAQGKADSARSTVLADLKGKTEKEVDAYLAAARDWVKATYGNPEAQKRMLGNVSRIVSGFRKDSGWAGKRAKGAGRKAKAEAKPEVDTSKLSPIEKCEAALALIVKYLPKVGASEREAFRKLATTTLAGIK